MLGVVGGSTAFDRGFLFKSIIMLQIKKEFKELIPALTAEEFKQLEDNCLAEGIREKILTWNGFIIDGHNRYEIATKWNLDYETESKSFKDEYHVKIWMLNNQLGRRNVTKEQKKYLIGKRHENEKQRHGGARDKNYPLQRTAQKIAKEVGVSEAQVKLNEQFAKGVDKLGDELKQGVLQGKVKINYSDIQEIAKAEDAFVATSEKEILEKAKQLKEQRKQEYKEKIQQRIEKKVQEEPISKEEQELLNKVKNGETVVINMNTHFHVLKYAKANGVYKQIDRYSEFGNPFFLDSDGDRDQVCDGYVEYFKHKRSLHGKVKELKGKVLGCHCTPLRCHGDHLKMLADGND